MVKISGSGRSSSTGKASTTKSAKSSGAGFSVDATSSSAGQVSSIAEATPTIGIGAVIALQTDSIDPNTKKRAGERALMLLDRIQEGLLTGRVMVSDLRGLADAASAKEPSGDASLDAIYDQIALRARIELAKLGH